MDSKSSMSLFPFSFAKSNGLLFDGLTNKLLLKSDAPIGAVLEAKRFLGFEPEIESLSSADFDLQLQRIYANHKNSSSEIMDGIENIVGLDEVAKSLSDNADLLSGDDDAPVIKLLNAIFFEALREKASDIHVEPYENEARIRFRLDGALRTVLSPPATIAPLIISRIKVLAKLDIAEKRVPQDGRMTVHLGGRAVDLRVSTMPSSYGERVVLRLMDKNAGQLNVDDLGMDEKNRTSLDSMIARPHGIILVTGPTGSGKTTTLYAALQQMDRQQRNIMTVEDPIEYDLPGVSQTQINQRAGMTFAKSLRAILRQDPDVILVGEIRDKETAEIAIQASLTGHLVLSTLHTNTAAGAVTRLQDLGIDSYLLASTLRGVLAQRLVRKLCEDCKVEEDSSSLVELHLGAGAKSYQAAGCNKCHWTGYNGRQSLFEIAEVDDGLQRLIHDQAGEPQMETYIRQSVPSIIESGFDLVKRGKTDLKEVLRVTST
jgi:general secretion pathway protein E